MLTIIDWIKNIMCRTPDGEVSYWKHDRGPAKSYCEYYGLRNRFYRSGFDGKTGKEQWSADCPKACHGCFF